MSAQGSKAFENHNIPIMIEFITAEYIKKKSFCLYWKPGNFLGKAFFFFFFSNNCVN